MKKILFIYVIAYLTVSGFIPAADHREGILGTIEPADCGRKVWGISGRDSVSAIPMLGKFSLTVSPGNWLLVVEAAQPYKNAVIENVLVQENQYTDVGVIKLLQ
jgi:hypothetical protein